MTRPSKGPHFGEKSTKRTLKKTFVGGVLSLFFLHLLSFLAQVNPVDVVPQLLALGGDSGQFVRSEAFRLLTVEDSKNSEFVRTRLLDGLFMAYT